MVCTRGKICVNSRTEDILNLSSLRSGIIDEELGKMKEKKSTFWQENEGVILDDENFDGKETNYILLYFQ